MRQVASLNQTRRRKLVFIIVFLLVGISLFTLSIDRQGENLFCLVEDNLYRTIHASSTTWEEYFFRSPEATATTHIYFSTEDGQQFTVIKLGDIDQFFVVTEYDYPHSYLGAKGYMFSPSKSPTWGGYNFTQISPGIYCYNKD